MTSVMTRQGSQTTVLITCFLTVDPTLVNAFRRFAAELSRSGGTLTVAWAGMEGISTADLGFELLPLPQSLTEYDAAKYVDDGSSADPYDAWLAEVDANWADGIHGQDIPRSLSGIPHCMHVARQVMASLKPSIALIWSSGVYPVSRVWHDIARQMGIPAFCLERGFLPGTWMVDAGGMNAQGDMRAHPVVRRMLLQHRSTERIDAYRRWHSTVRPRKYGRPGDGAASVRKALGVKGRLVVIVGGLDCAGLKPRTTIGARLNSPGYHDSLDVVRAVERALEGEPHLHIVFKAHPGEQANIKTSEIGSVKVVRDIDSIDLVQAADVVVAGLTGLGFETLLLQRPLVLVARSAIQGVGAAYEALNPEELATALRTALREGAAEKQHKADCFLDSLLTYCLYGTDDGVPALPLSDLVEHCIGFGGLGAPDLSSAHSAMLSVAPKYRSPVVEYAQLFFDTGAGFNETQSVRQEINRSTTRLQFELPADSGVVVSLRFDPLNDYAVIRVGAILLVKRNGETVQILNFQDNASCADSAIYYFSHQDPQFLFALPPDLAENSRKVVIDFEVIARGRAAETLSQKVQIGSLRQAMIKQDEQIGSLSCVVADRDDQITGLHQRLSERNEEIAALTKSIANCKDEVLTLNRSLLERDSQVVQYKQKIADDDELIRNLQSTVMAYEAEMVNSQVARADRDTHVASLEKQIACKDREIADLNRKVAVMEGHIASMLRSTSWRATTPIRFLKHQLARGGHLVKVAPAAFAMGGGVRCTFRKALNLYRRDGVEGLKRGVRYVQSARSAFEMAAMHADSAHTETTVLHSKVVDRNDYQEWIRRYDSLDEATLDRMRERMAHFACRPKISVVLPVYDPPLAALDEAIWSVRNQLYPNWELCIADDASKNEAVRELLKRHASEDERIQTVFRTKNGHISAASNSALEIATGEFVALLDNDDLLSQHALFHVAAAINEQPDAVLLYSDEDKIDEAGRRYDPYFKCEFNYELLLSQNMICHLGVYRRDVLSRIGGFRLGFEGAQDYDLALRVIEQIEPHRVVHVPRVLYHWRAIAGSTALAAGEKNYAAEAGRRAIAEHLQRTGRKAQVVPAPQAPALNRVRFELPRELPLVSIIIPTRDRADLLGMCLDSVLKKTSYPNYEIVVIDNGSIEPETMALFARQPKDRVRVIRDDSPFNYSRLNNHGASEAKGDVLCLMNNDIEILTPDWIEEMVSFALRPDIGCVGARLWYPNGTLQHGGVIIGIGGIAGHSHKYIPKGSTGYFGRAVLSQSLSAVTAACLMVRREVFESVHGLDESLAVAFNDVDFCLRVRARGFRNVWTPFAEMNHHESASRGHEVTPEKQMRFQSEIDFMRARWNEDLRTDPSYSPNLTLDHEDFSLAWPPRVGLV